MPAADHVLSVGGLLANPTVRTGTVVGTLAAISAAVVGVFTVVRGQSFAGHALGDVSAAGGSAAFLLGISPLAGFIGLGAAAAAAISALGARSRGHHARDVTTGIVVGAGLGLAGLLLYLDALRSSTTGAAVSVMFGSLFAVAPSAVPAVATTTGLVVVGTAIIARPLVLASTARDLAVVQGVPVPLLDLAFLGVLVLAVALSSLTVGAILATALLIGPAATATRLARRPGSAMALSVAIAVGSTWLAIVLAYDSYYWSPTHRGWPVSFFVVSIVFLFHVATELVVAGRGRRHGHRDRRRRGNPALGPSAAAAMPAPGPERRSR